MVTDDEIPALKREVMLAINKGDHRTAFPLCERMAESGDAGFQYLTGMMLRDGFGTRVDQRRAFQYMKSAAEQGHADALCAMGHAYMNGGLSNLGYDDEELFEVPRNVRKGLRFYLLAAKKKHPPAMIKLGDYYFEQGRQDTKARRQSVRYFKRGVRLGDADCMIRLADLYVMGLAVRQSIKKARALYGRARDQDDGSAHNAAVARLEGLDELKQDLDPETWPR